MALKTTKGMRKATVWKLCLEMWDWIAEMIRAGDDRGIWGLKRAWLTEHGYAMENECFFCDWAIADGKNCENDCPGTVVDPRFRCDRTAYHYDDAPLKFHAKLHRMDKKRRQMNREKKKRVEPT